MKKRRAAGKRTFSLLLALAVTISSVPVSAGELFASGAEEVQLPIENEEHMFDVPIAEDEFNTAEETFTADGSEDKFQDAEEEDTTGDTDEIRYIKGRPLTEEEREEQLDPIRSLTELDPGPQVDSDLSSVPAAYGMRASAFPSFYDSRKYGYITSVKNQHPFGTCWAFGMASLLESSLLAQGKGNYDLSEEHLSYFFSNRQNDPLGNTPYDQNGVAGDYHKIGGNDYLAALFLSTWSGMTTEEDVPLPTDDTHTQDLSEVIPDMKAYNSVVHLKNASFSDYSQERMKEMITRDQAVSIMFDMSTSYYNPDTGAYCYPVRDNPVRYINHIVTVVGWDDNYSKVNFKTSSKVAQDGAWIVKNSWGTDWGEDGYFYLSYQDQNISNLVTAEAVAVNDEKYPNNYFYDGSSAISKAGIKTGQSVAAVFEAKAAPEKDEALGEVNVVTMSDDAVYRIQVYTNLADPSDPFSGTPAYSAPVTYTQDFAGVQTVEVPEVVLMPGSSYAVVLTNAGSKTIQFGVENSTRYKNTNGSVWFTSTAGVAENQTFFKGASASAGWKDVASLGYSFRIKAHTRTLNTKSTLDTPVFTAKANNNGYDQITWKKVTGAQGYNIYRQAASGGKWTKLAAVKGTVLKYQDKKITATASYRYTVRAWYKSSTRTYMSAYTPGEVMKAAPALQKVSSVKKEKNGIRIRWKAQKNCDGYRIYRKKKGEKYKLLATISKGTSASYLDKKAQKGVLYSYAVKAYVKEPYGKVYSRYTGSSYIKR